MDTILNLFDPIFGLIPGYITLIKPLIQAFMTLFVDSLYDPLNDIILLGLPTTLISVLCITIMGTALGFSHSWNNPIYWDLLFHKLPRSSYDVLALNLRGLALLFTIIKHSIIGW